METKYEIMMASDPSKNKPGFRIASDNYEELVTDYERFKKLTATEEIPVPNQLPKKNFGKPKREEGAQCPNCGTGTYVKSPKTGKVFCSNYCWLPENERPKR